MKPSFRGPSADLIRESLHRRLDPVEVPDLSALTARVIASRQPLRTSLAPRRMGYASLALTIGVIAAGIGYGLGPPPPTPNPGPTFIGMASALNLAVPYLTAHHVQAIHVPTFLPFSQVASFKTNGPRVVPIVRAGTGSVPRDIVGRPANPHTVYWIAISSQDAPVRIASNITHSATLATIDATPHPWLVIAASRRQFLAGGNLLRNGHLNFRLWNSTQLKQQDRLTHSGSAIAWQAGSLTYTILVQGQTVPQGELVWLARTMSHTTLTKPEAFSLVYHALQKNARGAPTLSTWVFTAHPDRVTHAAHYLTTVRSSTVAVRPVRGLPRRPGVAVVLPEPSFRIALPVLLPRMWHSPYAGFYATVSSQFNPGGYKVDWTRTIAPIGTTTVDPMSSPFLTVKGGDLVTTPLPPDTAPNENVQNYWAQVAIASHSKAPVAAWVNLRGKTVWARTQFTQSGPVTILEMRYRGHLYQMKTASMGNAFPAFVQLLLHPTKTKA